MADISEEDKKLRDELVTFGETVGKINEKTRPILIKKLNHLRARQKAADRPPSPARSKNTSPRKTTPVRAARSSSNLEGDEVTVKETSPSVGTKNLRRRTIDVGPTPDRIDSPRSRSPPRAAGRRSMGAFANGDSPFMAGSLRQSVSASAQGRSGRSGGDILVSPIRRVGVAKPEFVFDENDGDFSDDDYTFREVASTGVNTTQSIENGDHDLNSGDLREYFVNSQVAGPGTGSSASKQPAKSTWLELYRGAMSNLGSLLSFRWYTISRLLLALVAVFFVCVILLYVFAISSSLPTAESSISKLCPPDSFCSENHIKDVVIDIAEVLSKRAGDFDCGYSIQGREVSVVSLSRTLREQYRTQTKEFDNALQFLTGCSPECGIRLLDREKIETNIVAEIKYLESIAADKSLWCRLTTSIMRVFNYILVSVGGIVATLGTIYSIIWWKKKNERDAEEVNKLVEDIIVLLKNHAAACRYKSYMLPYLAIPHVRDALIPLADREYKQKIWERAAKMLSMHESRVREEVKTIDGEECNVWRWIDTFPTFSEGVSGARSQQPGTSSPAIKPTSACLRICNIVESSTQNYDEAAISEAVLAQCGLHSGILHIGISTVLPEGVYVKFVSEPAAAQACRLLHGWTYNGKLTSVKDVSALMYRTLFPESTNAMVPLRPTSRRLTESFSVQGWTR